MQPFNGLLMFCKSFLRFPKIDNAGNKFYDYKSIRASSYGGEFDRSKEGLDLFRAFYKNLSISARGLGGSTYLADGMFVWGRELGWIRDQRFLDAVELAQPSEDDAGRDLAILWRSHIACWAADTARKVPGDFFEFGCYEGYTSCLIRHYLSSKFSEIHPQRKYFWFDRFIGGGSQKFTEMSHDKSYYLAMKRANQFKNNYVLKGDVTSTYLSNSALNSRRVAFAHFDINDFDIEFRLLSHCFECASEGSVFLFDDYAMRPFSSQNKIYREFFAGKGMSILELPTGQGLVIF